MGRFLSWLRSPALHLLLLWIVHLGLFGVVLAAFTPGSSELLQPCCLGILLAQVSLLFIAFGLGPFRIGGRVAMSLVFIAYWLILVAWSETADELRSRMISPDWTFRDTFTACLESWNWQATEVLVAVSILAMAVFAGVRRWLVRFEFPSSGVPQIRQPLQFRLRTLFLLTFGVALSMAVARFVRGLPHAEVIEAIMKMLFALWWLISMLVFVQIALTHRSDFWRLPIAVTCSITGIALQLFCRPALDLMSIAVVSLLVLGSQIVFVLSLLVFRERGWRIRWRWQARSEPWKRPVARDDEARRTRRVARRRRALYGALCLAAGGIVFYLAVVIPGERKRHAVALINSRGGEVLFYRVRADESLTVKLLKNWLPREYFDSVSTIDLNLKEFSDDDLLQLAPLTSVRYLSLESTSVSDRGLTALADWTHLHYLRLSHTPIIGSGLVNLSRLTELGSLRLWGLSLGDDGLAQLPPLPNLQELELDGTRISGAGLSCLAGLPKLETLSLSDTPVTDAAMEYFVGLDSLSLLDLENTPVTDDSLTKIAALSSLKRLYLSGTSVTDDGLSALQKLSVLEHLSINRTKITDAALVEIAKFPELTSLECQGTTISNEGLAVLETMPELKSLDIAQTPITDAGLEHLARIPSLRVLRLVDTRVSAAGVAAFRESMPDLAVLWVPPADEEKSPAGEEQTQP